MSSLAALRNHIPHQFDKSANKPSPQPPAQPPSNQGEAAAASQDASNQPPSPPQTTKILEIAPRGHTMAVTTADGAALLTITFANTSTDDKAPDLIVLRGNGAGDEIASAQFHRWTSSKTDLHINGRKVRVKKDFESSTGLGRAKWERDGRKAMRMKVGKEVVARFEAVGKGNRKKGTGQFEILKEGLSRDQLEETVISCLVERERMRRDGELGGELLQEGVWELFMASVGL